MRNLKVFSIEPQLERLESTFKIIEAKYRNIKKQQEVIADKIVEDGGSEEDQLLSDNQKVGASLKDNYLKVAKAYAAYQKKLSQPSPPTVNPDTLEAMTSAVTKMTEAMQGSRPMQVVLRSYQYHPGMVVVDFGVIFTSPTCTDV